MAGFVYNYSRKGKAVIGPSVLDGNSPDEDSCKKRELELLQWQAGD